MLAIDPARRRPSSASSAGGPLRRRRPLRRQTRRSAPIPGARPARSCRYTHDSSTSQAAASSSAPTTSVGQCAPAATRESDASVTIAATGPTTQAQLRHDDQRTTAIRSSVGRGRATSSSSSAVGIRIPALNPITIDSTGRPHSHSPATTTTQTISPPGVPVSQSPTPNAVSQPGKSTPYIALAFERSMSPGADPT